MSDKVRTWSETTLHIGDDCSMKAQEPSEDGQLARIWFRDESATYGLDVTLWITREKAVDLKARLDEAVALLPQEGSGDVG